jgi:hypothetical protein
VVVELSDSETHQILMSLQMLVHGLAAVEETKELQAAKLSATELLNRLKNQNANEVRARLLEQRKCRLSQREERQTQ